MDSVKSWSIYVLRDPVDGAIRYVGFTTLSVADRLKRHIYIARSSDKRAEFPVARWIRKISADGSAPAIETIETGVGDWSDREKFHIARCRAEGCDLLNLSLGGHITPPQESRDRAGRKQRGRVKSDAERRNISQGKIRARTKRPDTSERNRRSGEWLRGRKLTISEEERERRREQARALSRRPHWLSSASEERRREFAAAQAERTRATWREGRRNAAR